MSKSRITKPMLPREQYVQHLLRNALIASGILSLSLLGGVFGYHFLGNLAWIDALLNASMILAGMGPVDRVETVPGKLFASGYAIFSGVVFLSSIAIFLTPVAKRVMHRLRLDMEADE